MITDEVLDFIEKKTTIISPYFPTEISMAGHKTDEYYFSIDNLVDNSLKAEFNIYTGIVGDVMDGIEGMIRAPYGCFEQVSSTTYPNILVLKYLKEANKSKPEIEKRALDFIKIGYKKLAGYETSLNGFEWYGDTPPHEALSAYGLMQFKEMEEVYNGVNQKLIERTITFLKGRRDGKGGFKQNRGRYGFSAAPENVNNAYINYAISESKINTDFSKEYNFSYEEALKSEDSYRMALMACASYNYNKIDKGNLLIQKIKNNIQNYGFENLPVENTLTRSYGNAKKVEAVAFSLLALLKQKEIDKALLLEGVEFIISQRKRYGFGSTQSTCMALKALIEYTKYEKKNLAANGGILSININGKIINSNLVQQNDGKINVDGLESYLTSGEQKIAVKFSNANSTYPYSMNIFYDSHVPQSSKESPFLMKLDIENKKYKVGDNVSLNMNIENLRNKHLGMVTSVIGIPSGTTPQPWQLKKLVDEKEVAYYEIFDNYIVFYWRSMKANDIKNIRLDLKADIAGTYIAPASSVYLYYGNEFITWIAGNKITIEN